MPTKLDELVDYKNLSSMKILTILERDSSVAYTQEELAELTELDQSTVSRILKNLISNKKVIKKFKKDDIPKQGRPTVYYCLKKIKENE